MIIGTNFYDIYQHFLCSLSFFEDFVSVNFTFIKVSITVSKEKMKKKIIIGIAAIIVIAGIWGALNKEKATQMIVDLGMAMTSSVKHRNPSTEKAKFEITAEAFSKAFKDNAAEANKQYINQAVLIEGDITTIAGVTLTLNNIACNIDSSEVGKLKDLKVGAKVKVQGLVVGYNDLMEEIALAQCTIK